MGCLFNSCGNGCGNGCGNSCGNGCGNSCRRNSRFGGNGSCYGRRRNRDDDDRCRRNRVDDDEVDDIDIDIDIDDDADDDGRGRNRGGNRRGRSRCYHRPFPWPIYYGFPEGAGSFPGGGKNRGGEGASPADAGEFHRGGGKHSGGKDEFPAGAGAGHGGPVKRPSSPDKIPELVNPCASSLAQLKGALPSIVEGWETSGGITDGFLTLSDKTTVAITGFIDYCSETGKLEVSTSTGSQMYKVSEIRAITVTAASANTPPTVQYVTGIIPTKEELAFINSLVPDETYEIDPYIGPDFTGTYVVRAVGLYEFNSADGTGETGTTTTTYQTYCNIKSYGVV